MKTLAASLLFLAFISVTPSAHGQAGAGHGGGIAEMRFSLAFEQVFKLFKYCAGEGRCALTADQLQLTKNLASTRSSELPNEKVFEYISEKAHKGFFIIDGQERIARTGDKPGGVIYVNLDLIYRKNDQGVTEAISYPEAIQVLAHELGHHQTLWNYKDHEKEYELFLNEFGAKYAVVAKRMGYSSSLGYGADNIRFQAMNTRDSHMNIEIVRNQEMFHGFLTIDDGETMYDLTSLVLDQLDPKKHLCCVGYYDMYERKAHELTLEDDDVIQSIQFDNPHWGDLLSPLYTQKEESVRLVGTASLFGWKAKEINGSLRIIGGIFRFEIEFKVKETVINHLTIVPGSAHLIEIKSVKVNVPDGL